MNYHALMDNLTAPKPVKFAEVKIRRAVIQATRYEPMKEIVQIDVRIPENGSLSNGWMSCKSIEEATSFAARYGYALAGDAGQKELF